MVIHLINFAGHGINFIFQPDQSVWLEQNVSRNRQKRILTLLVASGSLFLPF